MAWIRIVAAMNGSETVKVNLTHPIPVRLILDSSAVFGAESLFFAATTRRWGGVPPSIRWILTVVSDHVAVAKRSE
jgi:hypothetical protein